MPASVLAEVRFGAASVFQIVKGNLLEEPVDAIVNAANGMLAHGRRRRGDHFARRGARASGGVGPHRARTRSLSDRIRRR
jgi:hypothetical protein